MPAGFRVDEEPLREAVLRAYQEKRESGGVSKRILDAIRQFLSGPPGGGSMPGRYWFEEDPARSTASFLEDLEAAVPGLAGRTFDPLLAAIEKMETRKGVRELAPNIPVYVSSLAGAVAVKTGLDETLACAVLSAAILGLSRLGRDPFAGARGSGPKEKAGQ